MIDPGRLELYRLYHTKQLSLAGIGEHLGCSRAYVHKLMRRHGIKRRSRAVAGAVARKHGRFQGPAPGPRGLARRAEARAAERVYIS